MNTSPVNFEVNNQANGALTAARRGQTVSGAFEALFAQIAQNTLNQTADEQSSAARTQSTSSSAVTGTQEASLASPAGTPLARLEEAVRSTGQEFEKIELPSSARTQLKQVLTNSGYTEADAEQIINRSTDQAGNINLKKLFDQLPAFVPVQGPALMLDLNDKPLLIQALKDLGFSGERIQRFLEAQTQEDGKLKIQGLPALLAEAGDTHLKVDRTVLKDLLTRLGLKEAEVQNLLDASSDAQGRVSAKGVLAMLQRAAASQDQAMAQTLKDLASQAQVKSADSGADDARQIKAQVIKALEAGQARQEAAQAKSAPVEALAQEAKDAVKPEHFGRLAEARLEGEASRLAAQGGGKAVEAAAEGRGAGGQTQTQGQAAAAKAAVEGLEAQTRADKPQTQAADAANQAVAAAGRASAAQGGVTATRGPLPAYVVRQVSDQIVQMVLKNTDTLRLELKPANLGSLDLAISVKDGVVKATLMAESVAVKQALEAGLDNLRQQLTLAGLKADRLEVLVNPDAQRQQTQAGGEGQSQGRRSGSGRRGVDALDALNPDSATDEAAGAAIARPARGRISLFA